MRTWQTKLLQITAFSVGITKLNQRIVYKDDIEFVTEFPCLLGLPVLLNFISLPKSPEAVENKAILL